MDLKDKRVLVVGVGLSGMAAGKLLVQLGAYVTFLDNNATCTKEQIMEKLPSGKEIKVILGSLTPEQMKSFQLVVLSPGVPVDQPQIQKLRQLGIPIWGEVELAFSVGKGKIAAITGTNGKTTTTSLTGEIMKTYYESVFVVGNIGIPYTQVASETREDSVVVAEMSSFQLETIHTFHPQISAILNLSPDHLNRHHTMEAYIQAKLKITENQTKEDICILNYEDPKLRELARLIPSSVFFFSSKRPLETGIYLDEAHNIIYNDKKKNIREIICKTQELRLLGIHNYENVMAAAGIALSMGVPLENIQKAVKEFAGVEHRIEFVAEKKGVKYYNDSKGTNPDAAIKGIQAMNRPTVLIAGGYDKESEYEEWIKAWEGKVIHLVLVGQTKEKIKEAALKCGFHSIELADTFEKAVQASAEYAKAGDAVLLSPACASWGMFQNYEERGNRFKELVYEMEE